MDKKVTGILSYLGILWLVAYFAGDKDNAKFHLNQGLVLLILYLVGSAIAGVFTGIAGVLVGAGLNALGLIFSIVSLIISIPLNLVCLVFMIMGIIAVCNDEEKELPIIGKFQLLK